MLTAFGDESSDETHKRVFAIAALFGNQEQWDALEAKWRKRTGGVDFHATECDSDQGTYKTFAHRDNKNLYKDLTILLAESKLLGYGVALDLISQEKYLGELLPESPYYKCFGEVVIHFAHIAFLSVPQEQVRFIFDRRLETQYNSTFLYDYMAKLSEWGDHTFVDDKIHFASRDVVGIQAADLWAREVMKHLDNQIGPKKRDTRQSLKALRNSKRFGANWYVGEYFEGLAKAIAAMDGPDGYGAFKQGAYKQWLTQNKELDTYAARLRYLVRRDIAQRAAGNSTHFEDVHRWTLSQ